MPGLAAHPARSRRAPHHGATGNGAETPDILVDYSGCVHFGVHLGGVFEKS
jgi:hypothetical protein